MTIYRRPDPIPRPAGLTVGPLQALRTEVVSLTHLGARQIFQAILRGHFPEGSILPNEDQLGAQLQVSRTALREAVTTLAAKGVLQPRRKRGTQVLSRLNWSVMDRDLASWSLDPGNEHASREIWQTVCTVVISAVLDAGDGQASRISMPFAQAEADRMNWRQDVLVWLAGCRGNSTFSAIAAQGLACLNQTNAPFLAQALAGLAENDLLELQQAIKDKDSDGAAAILSKITVLHGRAQGARTFLAATPA